MQQYQAVSKILLGAKDAINAVLSSSEDELHRLKICQSLQQLSDGLLLVTGAGDLAENKSTVLGPAKTIGGKPLGKVPRITEKDLVASDDKVYLLKQEIKIAWENFAEIDSAAILANMKDIVIRGVAKKAGLQVTKDNPKEITIEFIDQVKKAIADAEITGAIDIGGETKSEPETPGSDIKGEITGAQATETATPTDPPATQTSENKQEGKKSKAGK